MTQLLVSFTGTRRATVLVASLLTGLFVILLGAEPSHAEGAAKNAGTVTSRADLVLEEAHTMKLQADEEFLAGDRSRAQSLYRKAKSLMAEEIAKNNTASPQEQLLRQEIDYRLLLLTSKRQLDFWGPQFSDSPVIPAQPLTELDKHLNALKNISQEIEEALAKIREGGKDQIQVDIGRERSEASSKVSDINALKFELVGSHHSQRVEAARERMDQIAQQTAWLRAEQDKHMAKLGQAEKALSSAVMKAVSESAGLPVDLSAVANGESLEKSLLSAAAAAASSPEFAESLKDVGGTAADVAEVYQQGQQVVSKIKQSEKTLNSLRDAVRKPTFENLSRLGGTLYDQLDDSSKVQWEGFVRDKAKPLLPLVELARDNEALRQAVLDNLREAGLSIPTNDLNFDAMEDQVKKHLEGFIHKQEGEFRQVLDSRIRETLDEAGKQKWEQYWKHNKTDVMALADRAGVDQAEVKKAIRGWLSEANIAVAQTETKIDSIQEHLKGSLENIRKQREAELHGFFDGVMQKLNASNSKDVLKSLTKLNLGAKYSTDHPPVKASLTDPTNRKSANVREPSEESFAASEADRDTAMISAVAGPLALVCPQAALVSLGAQIYQALSNIHAEAAQVNDISDQVRKYVVEELTLRDQIGESLFESGIADADRRVAIAHKDAAGKELQLWNSAMEETAVETDRARQKIGFRLGLAFFHAEMLRYEYDRLDRAVGMWTGALEANRGNIFRLLKADPNTMRLALDEDIHLYDWFTSERDEEKARDDVDRLLNHWRKVREGIRLVLNNIGVGNGQGNIGIVGSPTSTDNQGFHLSKIVPPHEWEEFQKWQAYGRSHPGDPQIRPFNLSFYVHPSLALEGKVIDPQNGMRVVRVRMGIQMPGAGGLVPSSDIKLSHPGFGYVPVVETDGFHYVKELLKPLSLRSLDLMQTSLDQNEQLQARWGRLDYNPVQFEGYPLYAVWRVTFLPTSDTNFRLEDVRIRFSYHVFDLPADPDQIAENDPSLVTLTDNGRVIQLPPETLAIFGNRQSLKENINEWSSETGTKWTHGKVVEDSFWSQSTPTKPSAVSQLLSGGQQ